MRGLLKLSLVMAALFAGQPVLACEGDANIRTARLALPSDVSLNVYNAQGVTLVAPGECSGGLYQIAFPALLAKAEAGDAKAMDHVGLMLSAGAGVKQDWKAATKWLAKASAAGSGEASYRLGIMNQFGLGSSIDPPKAMAHYAAASEKSVAFASTNLGMMYFQGIGTAKNVPEAVRFFELARTQGDHVATQNLASIFAQGLDGIAIDEPRAFALAQEAAQYKITAAMRLLGFFYANGIGVTKDLRNAYLWAALAAKRGDAPGKQLASRIQPLLPAGHVAEHDKAVDACAESGFEDCFK